MTLRRIVEYKKFISRVINAMDKQTDDSVMRTLNSSRPRYGERQHEGGSEGQNRAHLAEGRVYFYSFLRKGVFSQQKPAARLISR